MHSINELSQGHFIKENFPPVLTQIHSGKESIARIAQYIK